jgi:nucleotide-binding universal stress UspA family protein
MPEPIRNIVAGVATPFAGDPTLRAAVELARGCGAELHLVHAIDAPVLSALKPDHKSAYLHHRSGREQRLRDALRDAVAETGGRGMRVRAWVYPMSPGEAILTVARRVDADLVVVGCSRHGALEHLVVGTAAQRVIRASPAPVLVVRGPFAGAPERVLLTSDLSDLSAAVHEAALDTLAALYPGAEPQVRSLAVAWHGMLPPPLPPELLVHETRGELGSFLAARRPRPFVVEPTARLGRPADEIAREAAEWDADLLVLGTHARHGVERFFAGSVAEAALEQAPCHVLVVPPVRTAAAGDAETEEDAPGTLALA